MKDVFVNGRHIGQHRGPFSASAFDLTPALKLGQANTLDVRVTNRDRRKGNCFSPPSSNLYYVNGGMFRKAWLMKTGAVHIFPDLGSRGVYLTPANITQSSADLERRTVVCNPLSVARRSGRSSYGCRPKWQGVARNSRPSSPFRRTRP